jgi:hypothetical protein
MPSKKAGPVVYKFPLKGQVQSQGYASQPLDSAILCQNVMPFDPQTTRLRGGQRAGTTQLQGPIVSSSTRINRLHQVQKVDGTGTRCCATAGAQLWAGADFKTLAVVNATFITSLVEQHGPAFVRHLRPGLLRGRRRRGAQDVQPRRRYTAGTLAATAGVLPGVARSAPTSGAGSSSSSGRTSTSPAPARRPTSTTRSATSWRPSPPGRRSTFGNISQPPYALIPFSNDTMIVGCDHSMLLVKGDPADGGVC